MQKKQTAHGCDHQTSDERNIIIDSKVSLTDYDRFMKADDADEQEAALQRHVRSVKGHVDILTRKAMLIIPAVRVHLHVHPVEPAFANWPCKAIPNSGTTPIRKISS